MSQLKEIEINKDDNNNIQCAACGYINDEIAFITDFKNGYKVCPNCGAVKYVSDITKSYRK